MDFQPRCSRKDDEDMNRRSETSLRIERLLKEFDDIDTQPLPHERIIAEFDPEDIRKNYRRSIVRRAVRQDFLSSTPFHRAQPSNISTRISDISPIDANDGDSQEPVASYSSPKRAKTLKEQAEVEKTKSVLLQNFLEQASNKNETRKGLVEILKNEKSPNVITSSKTRKECNKCLHTTSSHEISSECSSAVQRRHHKGHKKDVDDILIQTICSRVLDKLKMKEKEKEINRTMMMKKSHYQRFFDQNTENNESLLSSMSTPSVANVNEFNDILNQLAEQRSNKTEDPVPPPVQIKKLARNPMKIWNDNSDSMLSYDEHQENLILFGLKKKRVAKKPQRIRRIDKAVENMRKIIKLNKNKPPPKSLHYRKINLDEILGLHDVSNVLAPPPVNSATTKRNICSRLVFEETSPKKSVVILENVMIKKKSCKSSPSTPPRFQNEQTEHVSPASNFNVTTSKTNRLTTSPKKMPLLKSVSKNPYVLLQNWTPPSSIEIESIEGKTRKNSSMTLEEDKEKLESPVRKSKRKMHRSSAIDKTVEMLDIQEKKTESTTRKSHRNSDIEEIVERPETPRRNPEDVPRKSHRNFDIEEIVERPETPRKNPEDVPRKSHRNSAIEDIVEISENPKKKPAPAKKAATKKRAIKTKPAVVPVVAGPSGSNEAGNEPEGLRRSCRQRRPPPLLPWKKTFTDRDIEIYGDLVYAGRIEIKTTKFHRINSSPVLKKIKKNRNAEELKEKKRKKKSTKKPQKVDVPVPHKSISHSILPEDIVNSNSQIDYSSDNSKKTDDISVKINEMMCFAETSGHSKYVDFASLLKKKIKFSGCLIVPKGDKVAKINRNFTTVLNAMEGEVSLMIGDQFYEKVDRFLSIPPKVPFEIHNNSNEVAILVQNLY